MGAYLSNVSAGIIGSLIIIVLVDRVIERNRAEARRHTARFGLQRLRSPIRKHMRLLCTIYKAAAETKPEPLPSTFEETFNDEYYNTIAFLDFTMDVAGVVPRRNWFTHLDLETKTFKETIEQTIHVLRVPLTD